MNAPETTMTILTDADARRLIRGLSQPFDLIAELMYATGLRLPEILQLRAKDIDAPCAALYVRRVNGANDRFVAVPPELRADLRLQLEAARKQHTADLRNDIGTILPLDIDERLPLARTRWCWQYVFPSAKTVIDPFTQLPSRTHLSPTACQRALQTAAHRAGLGTSIHSHSLRHAFAARLVERGEDLRTIQSHLGHDDLQTTALYARQLEATKTAEPVEVDRAWITRFVPEQNPINLFARIRAMAAML